MSFKKPLIQRDENIIMTFLMNITSYRGMGGLKVDVVTFFLFKILGRSVHVTI